MKSLHVFTLFTTADSFFNGQYGFLTSNSQQIDVASSDADASEFSDANGTRFFPLVTKAYGGISYSKSLSVIKGYNYVVVPFFEGMKRTVQK